MAFGFLKKVAGLLSGGKDDSAKNPSGKSVRGRRGRRGRHAAAATASPKPAKQQQGGARAPAPAARPAQQQRQRPAQPAQRPPAPPRPRPQRRPSPAAPLDDLSLLSQTVYTVGAADRFKVLFNFLSAHRGARTVVFCGQVATAEAVAASLVAQGVRCETFEPEFDANRRAHAFAVFNRGRIRTMVSTDPDFGLFANGIEFVVNYDLPAEPEMFLRRLRNSFRPVGRPTGSQPSAPGRPAGSQPSASVGTVISFADEDTAFSLPEIEAALNLRLPCTVLGADSPLLAALPATRTAPAGTAGTTETAETAGTTGTAGTVEATETVATETVEEGVPSPVELVLPSRPANARTASGRLAFIREDFVERAEPDLSQALEPKVVVDESDIYSKPPSQSQRFEEWQP